MKKVFTLILALAFGIGLKAQTPDVTVNVEEVDETSALVTIIPNEYCAVFYYNLLSEAEMQAWIDYTGLEVGEILRNYGIQSEETASHFFDGLELGIEYFVWAVPADTQGNLYEVHQVPLIVTPTPPDIMPDFTATDIDGNEIHLYDLLDGGQTVLLNLFLRDTYSEEIMPFVTESYRLFGCNQNDVYYIEICPQDEDDACRAWAQRFGVTYPTISRTGGGNDIAQSIPVAYYPTVAIVNPDHSFAYRDLYPIENTQTIVNALEGLGCEQHECPQIGELVLSTDTVYVYQDCVVDPGEFTVYNMTTENVQIIGYLSDEFDIECDSGYGGTSIIGMAIAPSDSLTVRVWAYPTGKEPVVSGTMRLITSIGEFEVTIIFEWLEGVEESQKNNYFLYPNPANEFVTLKGENLGTVRVYNALGQKVEEFEANSNELHFGISHYGNGVYYLKAGEKTMRFVVRH